MRRVLIITSIVPLLLGGCLASPGAGGLEETADPTPWSTSTPTSDQSSATPSPEPSEATPPAIEVPAEIRDRPVVLRDSDGQLFGGTSLDDLHPIAPKGEHVLLVMEREVLTTTLTDGSRPMELRLRDLATGEARFTIETTAALVHAVAADGVILLSGYLHSVSPSGILSLDTQTGILDEVTSPAEPPDDPNLSASRYLRASPSGKTIVSAVYPISGRSVAGLVDIESRKLRPIGEFDGLVRYVTDEVAVVVPDFPDRMFGYSLTTGELLWKQVGDEIQWGYMTTDGRIVQSYIDHSHEYAFTIALIDPTSGKRSVVWSAPMTEDHTIWTSLSTDRYVVIGHEDERYAIEAPVASILDLETGEIDLDALTIRTSR